MASLLSGWPYQCVDPLSWMAWQKGARVVYHNSPGTIVGYDFFSPSMWYVELDENRDAGIKGATRVHVTSLDAAAGDEGE